MPGILHKKEDWRNDWEAALYALRRPQTELAVKGCALLVSLMEASCGSLDAEPQMGPDDLDGEDVFCDLCVLLRCGLDSITAYTVDEQHNKFKQKWHHQSRLKIMEDNSVGLDEGLSEGTGMRTGRQEGILAARRAVSHALKTLAHLQNFYNWHGDDMLDEAGGDANWMLTLTCLTCGDTTTAETWAEDAASVGRSCTSECGGFLRCVHVEVKDEGMLQHHSVTKLTTCGRRQLAGLRRGLREGEARHVKWLEAEHARAKELLVAERFRLVRLRLPEGHTPAELDEAKREQNEVNEALEGLWQAQLRATKPRYDELNDRYGELHKLECIGRILSHPASSDYGLKAIVEKLIGSMDGLEPATLPFKEELLRALCRAACGQAEPDPSLREYCHAIYLGALACCVGELGLRRKIALDAINSRSFPLAERLAEADADASIAERPCDLELTRLLIRALATDDKAGPHRLGLPEVARNAAIVLLDKARNAHAHAHDQTTLAGAHVLLDIASPLPKPSAHAVVRAPAR